MNFHLFRASNDYIEFLRMYDNKVLFNKDERRPYVGIVLQINNFNYFAPLTSPKPKHRSMSNQIDFFKLDHGRLGAINFNNMIPVPDCGLIHFEISLEEENYKNLLYDQLNWMNNGENNDIIKRKAYKLYDKVVNRHSFINARCCEFKLLEEKCIEFSNMNASFVEAAITTEDDEIEL